MENQPDFVLLQETLAEKDMIAKILSALFPGWSFVGLDARGRSGALFIGWRARSTKLLNSWEFNSGLGGYFLVEGIGKELRFINVYDPHTN